MRTVWASGLLTPCTHLALDCAVDDETMRQPRTGRMPFTVAEQIAWPSPVSMTRTR